MRYDDEKELEYIPKGTHFDADMSDEDKALIKTLQDAWSAYNAKGDEAGKTAAHNQAQSIRAKYGYSGGADGSDYIKLAQPTDEFSYASAPQYVNRWQSLIDEAANSILNRDAFTYDHTQDPLYQQMEQSYTQKGQQAMEDTLGIVSQRTGGLASSYAAQAGQQAYNGYMSQLADKIPELRQLAYSMYMDEGDRMRDDLALLQGMENQDYSRYLNNLGQYNTDRSFAYGQFTDALNRSDALEELAYNRAWDEEARTYNRAWDENERDYSRLWDEEARAYTRGQDDERDALYKAETLAASGDFSGYKALGYTDEQIAAMQSYWQGEYDKAGAEDDYSKALYKAETLAMYGDFSGYKELGYTDEQIAAMQKAYQDQLETATPAVEDNSYTLTYSDWWNQGVRSEGEAYDRALQDGYSNTEAENMASYFENWKMNQNDLLENTTGVSNYQALSDSLKSMQGIIPLDSAQGMLDNAYLDGLIDDKQYNELQDYIDGQRWL